MSRTHGTKETWLEGLREDGATLLAAVDEIGVLALSVPSCPGWTVGDLVQHLGSVYRRIRAHAGSGDVGSPWPPLMIPDDTPRTLDSGLITWFGEELALLDAFLEALDPDLPAWNWAPYVKTAGFWHRRAAHETAVHRWDSQLATGLSAPLDGRFAADTVAEVLDTFLPAGVRRFTTDPNVQWAQAHSAGVVHLHASDSHLDWYVRLRGEGVALLDTDTLLDDDVQVTRADAEGNASDLALALWGRIAFDVLRIDGDPALLDALRVG